MPASLENSPRFAPWEIAVFKAMPTAPPMMAFGAKAYRKIMAKVAGRYRKRTARTINAPVRKRPAITGTSFSVTDASLWVPPMKIKAQIKTRMTPTIQEGTPNAVWMVDPMELDWTIQPKNPSASVMAMAKNPARNLPNAPLNA